MSVPDNQKARCAKPLITIAIPTRNRAQLLQNCVASALAQSYSNIEVLVSDNASSDNTLEMLESFDDPRLKILRNAENIGLTANFNKCVYEAAGEYINIISDDNILRPTFLEKCVQLIQEESGLPMVVGVYEVVATAENRTVPVVVSKRLRTGIWPGTEILKEHLRGNLAYEPMSSVIRADLFRRNGAFSPKYVCAGDELIMGRILLEGNAGLVNEPCASFLFHTHPTENFSFGVTSDFRFTDMVGAIGELSNAAGDLIPDGVTRQEIQNLAGAYLAYKAIQECAVCRQQGASFVDVVQQLWRWRTYWSRCTLWDLLTALRVRSVARILLPTPAIKWTRILENAAASRRKAHS
jgi:glycosyltransferase involved in cell wall biosynthesis